MRKKKSRILHIGPVPPPVGGMCTYINGLMNSPLRAIFDMRLIKTDYVHKSFSLGWKRKVLNLINGVVLFFVTLWHIISWRPEIVHIQTNSGVGFYEKALLGLLARLLGRKFLLHVHGGEFRERFFQYPPIQKKIIRWLGNMSSKIVVASPQMQETWRIIGVDEGHVFQIDNAVELPEKTIWGMPNTLQKEHLTILFFTRIVLDKGILELLYAFKQLLFDFPTIRLRIVGLESHEVGIVKKTIQTLDLLDNVEFIGQVSEQEKKKEWFQGDIYAFPTHIEDQSYAILEAMSHGLPCVASNVGGIPSLIEHEENGFLVPSKNVKALTEELTRLILDPLLRKKIGLAGRKIVEDHFTWKRLADEMAEFYLAILSVSRHKKIDG